MQKWWLILVFLAGCAGAPAPEPVADVPDPAPLDVWGEADRLHLWETTLTWHGNPNAYQNTIAMAGQAAASSCVYPDGSNVYFTNLQLPSVRRIPDNTTALGVTLSWERTDYLRDALRLAYNTPSNGRYYASDPVATGVELVVPIGPADWEGDDFWGNVTHMWACLDSDDEADNVPPKTYLGDLTIRVDLLRDTDS